MEWYQITLLALLQGVTEFLPISSSAHLILLPWLTGWADQGLAFDVAVHLGTLLAVVGYFRREVVVLMQDCWASIMQRRVVGESRLAWAVLLGTIPVGLAGLLFKEIVESELRTPQVIIVTTILFGLLLWWADRYGRGERDESSLTWRDIAIIGLAQAVALIPGTSRSGITMTAALMLGLSRSAAARFSFLLSIPVIVLAGGLNGLDLIQQSEPVDWFSLGLGTVLAALSAYAAIHTFLKLLEQIGMVPFVIYRLLLGGLLLWLYGL
ncbi:undecaprenyl-diphosphate phosphatase [Ectothiorhodospiraceae bacterium BW-2]|nr:undecaprenyl-diphosphate phosphatase [Ectothiorhodospiraceae bacterium BW-2]